MTIKRSHMQRAFFGSLYRSTRSLSFDGLTDWAVNFNLFGVSTFPIRRFNASGVSMWIKNTKALAPNNAHQTICGRWFPTIGGGLSINEGGWRWMINDIATGAGTRPLHFHVCTHFLQGIWIYSTVDFPLDTWVHVTMTYDGFGAAAGLKMYWDGLEVPVVVLFDNWTTNAVNSNAFSHLLWGTQYTAWPAGAGGGSTWPPVLAWYFEGLMDESCFWRGVLSPADVWGLYNNGFPISPLHVGLPIRADRYFRMGEGSDGAPWVLPGSSIGFGRIPVGGTLTNLFWNNDGATPPLRVTEDVAA